MDIRKVDFEMQTDERPMATRLAEVVDFLSLHCGDGEYHMMHSVDDASATIARLTAEKEAAVRERDELREAVRHYPMTADDKPVYPGMEVWYSGDDKRLGNGPHPCIVQDFWDWDSDESDWEDDGGVYCSMVGQEWLGHSLQDCYSTLEAALAARPSSEDTNAATAAERQE